MNEAQPPAPRPEVATHLSQTQPLSEVGAAETFEFPACPVCGGHLVEIRQKRICERCHTICETCCEGGRG